MERQEQVRLLKEVMTRLDEGTNVDAGGIRRNPTWVYTCPDLAKREWETFYRDYPQVIGLTGDLPEPGSFITSNDFGVPVLATRDKDGHFRAFVNVCRHRGVLLESDAQGKRRRFTCPFHAWTYSSEGELVSIPMEDHFGKIDKHCHGLVPLPAVERHGFLWVHPNLFPNVQVNVTPFGVVLVRTYPDPGDPARCLSRIGFYARPDALTEYGELISNVGHGFAEIIRDEDYAVAARSQLGAEAGVPEYVIFGRNEPALHHYHNTYREALGMEPLELMEG